MNQKYLFALLVFFFLINVEKTHGCKYDPQICHPSGTYCTWRIRDRQCGAKVEDANLLPGSMLNLTVSAPKAPVAFGHFTIHTDYGDHSFRFLEEPKFIDDNLGDSTCCVIDGINNPYTSTWEYSFQTPPAGTWFDIWIAIYWHCDGKPYGNSLTCLSENVHYRGYVH